MDLFIKRILLEAEVMPSETQYPIDVENFDQYPLIGDGEEGIVRDYGKYAVKKYEHVNMTKNSKQVKLISRLIKTPNPDFIRFFYIFQYNDCWYTVMQKLTDEELDAPTEEFDELFEIENGDDYYEALIELEMDPTNKELLAQLQPVLHIPVVAFTVKMITKKMNDIKPENMAKVNGKFVLFDWY